MCFIIKLFSATRRPGSWRIFDMGLRRFSVFMPNELMKLNLNWKVTEVFTRYTVIVRSYVIVKIFRKINIAINKTWASGQKPWNNRRGQGSSVLPDQQPPKHFEQECWRYRYGSSGILTESRVTTYFETHILSFDYRESFLGS